MRRAVVALIVALLAAGSPVALAAAAGGPSARAAKHKTHHKKHKKHKKKKAKALGPKAGPALLYWKPEVAPQLTNTGIWHAKPILVSGATAYRHGEFLYQDFIYDDHGARELPDPTDPRAANEGDLFSKPNGTYTYPTGPGYANNAADLVEFRVKPEKRYTAFRITLNTLENAQLVAFSIAIGGRAGHVFAFPDGANVVAPAKLFLTVYGVSANKMAAQLVHAGSDTPVKGKAPRVKVDMRRRQIQVLISHRQWNPRKHTVRLAMGVGLWNAAAHSYLLPQAVASTTRPGGAGTAAHPPAFFNVAFRTHEGFPSPTAGEAAITDAAWWRDQQQGTALAQGNISPFFASVSFRKLWRKKTDNSGVPKSGPMDRILASHFEPAQGANYAHECGFGGATNAAECTPELLSRLQPYAIYVPSGKRPKGGWGLTLLLHSLSANYNQYLGTRNQSQFANRAKPSIVITPEARGPDQFYEGYGAADTFEVWADVMHHFKLNSAYSDITGYSMGGYGTFTLGAQFPDLFARAQPTVGTATNYDTLASFRNLPVLMWNNTADELVNPAVYEQTAHTLDSLGYRYELDAFQPCPTSPEPQKCSPVFPDHLELAVNDQYAPAAAFLGSATVNPNPAHVTYEVDPARDRPTLGIVGDHAYWLSALRIRSDAVKSASTGEPEGRIDAVSLGFGVGDPTPSGTQVGVGELTGGNLGTLHYVKTAKTWGPAPAAASSDTIDITATNIASMAIDVSRARVNCNVNLHIVTDGPLTVHLLGCSRTVTAG